MIKIVTDSTSDIPPETARALDIAVVPMFVEIDGVTYRDGENLTRRDFYANLPSFKSFPKTAAASPSLFVEAYRNAAKQGAREILSIHIARKFSGVCASADVAAKEVAAEGIVVHVVDSGSMTVGCGWPAVAAARMAADGAAAADILDHVAGMIPLARVYAMTETLKYLRKSGRANVLVAGIGELLQLRLLITLSAGDMQQVDRVRTRARAIERLLEVARESLKTKPEQFAVLYTSGPGIEDDVAKFRQQLDGLVPVAEQSVVEPTPVIGAHFGPQALGFAFVSAAAS